MGVEVMSQYPLIVSKKMTAMFAKLAGARSVGQRLAALASFRPSFLKPRIALLEGLTDPPCDLLMGQTAELLARDFGITREECDGYAAQSHNRAAKARDAGRFDRDRHEPGVFYGRGVVVDHRPIRCKYDDLFALFIAEVTVDAVEIHFWEKLKLGKTEMLK